MSAIEMIPPQYWRQLKRELNALKLDTIPETALPDGNPDGNVKAIRWTDALNAIIEHRCKEKMDATVQKRCSEITALYEKEKKRRENADAEVTHLNFILETQFGYVRDKRRKRKTSQT